MRKGMALPEHGHRGMELTMVLTGSFSEDSLEFRRGDVAVADEGARHVQVIGPAEPCICLTVPDAPLLSRGWLPKIVQRFAKI